MIGGQGGCLYALSFPDHMSFDIHRHAGARVLSSDGRAALSNTLRRRVSSRGVVDGVVPCTVTPYEYRVTSTHSRVAGIGDLQDLTIGVETMSAASLKLSSIIASEDHDARTRSISSAYQRGGCCSCSGCEHAPCWEWRAARCWCRAPVAAAAAAAAGATTTKTRWFWWCRRRAISGMRRSSSHLAPLHTVFETSSVLICACACAVSFMSSAASGMPGGITALTLSFYVCAVTITLLCHGFNGMVAVVNYWTDNVVHRMRDVPQRGAFQLATVVLSGCACAVAMCAQDNPSQFALASPLLLVFLSSPKVTTMLRNFTSSVLEFIATIFLLYTLCSTFAFACYWIFGVGYGIGLNGAEEGGMPPWFDNPFHSFVLFVGIVIGAPWTKELGVVTSMVGSVWPALLFCCYVGLARVVLLNLLLGNLVDAYRTKLQSEHQLEAAPSNDASKHAIVLFSTNAGIDSDQCQFELIAPISRSATRGAFSAARSPPLHGGGGVDASVEMKASRGWSGSEDDDARGGGGLRSPLLGGARVAVDEDAPQLHVAHAS